MAFNTLEYLEAGNVSFVFSLTQYDYKNLIRYVRESDRRINIIKGFLPKLRDSKPYFCFEIIYDIDEFIEDAKYLLDTYYSLDSFSKELFEALLNNSSLGFDYLEENFDFIISKFQEDLDFIFKFLFNNLEKCLELLKKLSLYSNLHIRYLFMKYLIQEHPRFIVLFYDDITKYLTSETFQNYEQLSFFLEYMNMKDVCDLAYTFFDADIDYAIWNKFKQFILEHYQYNELAYRLLSSKKQYLDCSSYRLVENKAGIEEFNKDADILFSTSSNYRLSILNGYSERISSELLESFMQQLNYFKRNGDLDDVYWKIDLYGLGRMLSTYVDKYLSLSNNHTYSFLDSGSTASCYRIGDYVIKLVRTKWSYEPIICPDLYIILPNLEEKFIRDKDGVVLCGLEVQKYLSRSAKNVPPENFIYFSDELRRLGYYMTDSLINGPCGDNCRLLDSYLDSSNPNPADWFKEYPLVLVDRDRVYKTNIRSPRQLRGGCS